MQIYKAKRETVLIQTVKTALQHIYKIAYLLHGAEPFLRSQLLLQLIKKFPAFYGTRKFITVLTSARHLSLSWAYSIQSPQPLPTSSRSILILSSHLRLGLPGGLFPSGFLTKTLSAFIFKVKIFLYYRTPKIRRNKWLQKRYFTVTRNSIWLCSSYIARKCNLIVM